MDSQARGRYTHTRNRSNNADEKQEAKRGVRAGLQLNSYRSIQTNETLAHFKHHDGHLDVEHYLAQAHLPVG